MAVTCVRYRTKHWPLRAHPFAARPASGTALLKILALDNQDVAAGKVKPVADVVTRLRAKRAAV